MLASIGGITLKLPPFAIKMTVSAIRGGGGKTPVTTATAKSPIIAIVQKASEAKNHLVLNWKVKHIVKKQLALVSSIFS